MVKSATRSMGIHDGISIGSINPKANNFDFLRFFLASAVILGHCLHAGHPLVIPFLKMPLTPGSHAVDGFFTISGFLICGSWLNSKGVVDYARKRFLRIYPGLISALLLCVLVVGPLGGANLATYFRDPETYRFFLPLILGPGGKLPGVFDNMPWGGSVNGPVWTIRFEIGCYILLALLGASGLLRKPRLVVGLFCAMLAVFVVEYLGYIPGYGPTTIGVGIGGNVLRLSTFFLSGVVCYLYRDRIKLNNLGLIVSLLMVFFLHNRIMPLAMAVFGTYLLLYFAFSPAIRLNRFAKFGDFSYGMYIYAFPIQQLITYHLGYQPAVPLFFCLTFVATLPIAMASWYLIEKPCLRLKSREKTPAATMPSLAASAASRPE